MFAYRRFWLRSKSGVGKMRGSSNVVGGGGGKRGSGINAQRHVLQLLPFARFRICGWLKLTATVALQCVLITSTRDLITFTVARVVNVGRGLAVCDTSCSILTIGVNLFAFNSVSLSVKTVDKPVRCKTAQRYQFQRIFIRQLQSICSKTYYDIITMLC